MDHSIFCGRQHELSSLKAAWDRMLSDPNYSPELHILVAESGLGKTRVVQEFYNWLSINADLPRMAGYWPHTLGKNGRNLEVSPPVEQCLPDNQISFIWMGIRCPDTTKHNSAGIDRALQSEMAALHSHLLVLQEQANKRKILIGKVSKSAFEIAVQLAGSVPLVGQPIGLLKLGYDLYKIASEDEVEREPDAAERSIASIRAFFSTTKELRIPLVLFLDDIQFSQGETQLTKFARQIIFDAGQNKWPLLVIATTWHQEWHEDNDDYPIISLLKDAKKFKYINAENLITHPLKPLRGTGGEDSLRPLIKTRFPGLLESQVDQILEKVDGNPRYLEEILLFLEGEIGLFKGFDCSNALAPDALKQLRKMEIEDVVRKRFLKAGKDVFAPLALASLQGMHFSKKLIGQFYDRLPNKIEVDISEEAFKKGETLYGLLGFNSDLFAEFSQRLHQSVAREMIGNVSKPEETVLKTLRSLIQEKVFDGNDLQLEEQLHACNLALSLFQNPSDINSDHVAIKSYNTLSINAHSRYAFDEALALTGSAIQRGLQHLNSTRDDLPPAFLNDLAAAHMIKGDVLQEGLQRPDDAVSAYDAAIKIMSDLRELLGDATPPAFLSNLASTQVNKGAALYSLLRMDDAVSAYDAAIKIMSDLLARASDAASPAFLHSLVVAHSNKGNVLNSLLRIDDAVAAYDAAIEIGQDLQGRLGDATPPSFLNSLAAAHVNKGSLLHSLRHFEDAIGAYNAAIEIGKDLQGLLGEATPPSFLNNLAAAHMNKGDVLNGLLRMDDALAAYDTAIEIREDLRVGLGDAMPPAFLSDLAISYASRAFFLAHLRKCEDIDQSMQKAISIASGLVQKYPGNGGFEAVLLLIERANSGLIES